MSDITAKDFYGAATYAKAVTPSELDTAFKWLNKAIVFEVAGDMPKVGMAFNAALKAEQKAFGTSMQAAA